MNPVRSFRAQCTVRVVTLTASLVGLAYLVIRTDLYATTGLLALVALLQATSLVRYVESTNRQFISFLDSVEFSDFSRSFAEGPRGTSFDELRTRFAAVMTSFREVRREREEALRYLQTVVQHVGVGIMVFDQNGYVSLLNNAARKLLDVSALPRIDVLETVSPELCQALHSILPGERILLREKRHEEVLQLALSAAEIRMGKDRLTLVSFQNIAAELSEKEMEAWQHLVRVLTHEIKNSLTPISSLAATVESLVDEAGRPQASEEIFRDMREALRTIQTRSEGLQHVVDAYRNLTSIPKPVFRQCRVDDLLRRVSTLEQPELTSKGVAFHMRVEPPTLTLTGDPQLLEQVVINLVRNAMDALESTAYPQLSVEATYDERSRVAIRVCDNGPGIEPHALESIFVPFYTTKKGGSGIGLSLSRQIMRLHRGSLTAESDPGVRTVFTMRF